MSNRKPATKEEMKTSQLGADNIREWDKIHNLAELIKQGKAKIVRGNGTPHTVIKEKVILRLELVHYEKR